jgi:signal transduction protein with GAF and PtsI domain
VIPDPERYLGALAEISRAITSELYLDDILKLIVIVTAEVMKSEICSLMLLDEQTGELRIRATQSVSEEYLKKPPLKIGNGVAGVVAQRMRSLAIKDIRSNPLYVYKDLARRENLRSLLSVPMCIKGRCIGVINCYTNKPHQFTQYEMDMLATVANQAAIAIENTELMVQTQVVREELEARKKIERAKDILQRNFGIDGDEAFRRMRKRSMDARKSLREVADAIILADLNDADSD